MPPPDDSNPPRMPLQPIIWAEDNVIRFRKNRLVEYLLDHGPFDMNHLALLPEISADERAQFAAMVGYSVSGWGDLSYVNEDCRGEMEDADRIAAAMVEERRFNALLDEVEPEPEEEEPRVARTAWERMADDE